MRLLAFYTASEPASIALLAGGGEAAWALEPGRQLERLVPSAMELLSQAGLRARELDGVAVALGPGSFTGLRVGAATALGLASGTGMALYGVGTLEIWAALALAGSGGQSGGDPRSLRGAPFCQVALDARRGELYVAGFRPAPDAVESDRPEAPGRSIGIASPQLVDGPQVLTIADALARLEPSVMVVGDGRELLVRAGMESSRPGFTHPPGPLAVALGRLVLLEPTRCAYDPASFTLDYLRDPQAVAARAPAAVSR